MTKRFTYNFVTKEIIGSKAAIARANKGIEPEYTELSNMIKAQPSFSVAEKVVQKANKKSYHALTIKRMAEYIELHSDSDKRMEEFEAIQMVAQAKGAKYPLTKKWFLAMYPEYKENCVSENEMVTATAA